MKYKDGEPCKHPGCLQHRTHPCEGCGRIGGQPKNLQAFGTPEKVYAQYQKYEFCKAMNCPLFDIDDCNASSYATCIGTAKELYHWLKDSGYKIVKEIDDENKNIDPTTTA